MDISSIIMIFWLLSEIVLNIMNRSKMPDSKQADKKSLSFIWATIFVAITAAVFVAIYINVPIFETNLLKYTSLVLVVAGVILRLVAIRTLGKFFTVNLSIDTEHRLIDKGLYKYIRHPSYSGSLLSFLGLALYFNNWICLAIILIPVVSVFIYRINIEEQLLLQQPGLYYDNYCKRTKRLIPFVY
jgi:protein-S-isoprenylcysteine O-methyltransferase Ste14